MFLIIITILTKPIYSTIFPTDSLHYIKGNNHGYGMESSSLRKAAKIPAVNEDLLVSIFIRLPVKSLLRFKCVCKSWYSLINSPIFIGLHLNNKDSQKDYFAFIESIYRRPTRSSFTVFFFSHDTMKFSSI